MKEIQFADHVSEKTRVTRRLANAMTAIASTPSPNPPPAATSRPPRTSKRTNKGGSAVTTTTGLTPDVDAATNAVAMQLQQRGGRFRCLCNRYYVSSHDDLVECVSCRCWSHAACMGVESPAATLYLKATLHHSTSSSSSTHDALQDAMPRSSAAQTVGGVSTVVGARKCHAFRGFITCRFCQQASDGTNVTTGDIAVGDRGEVLAASGGTNVPTTHVQWVREVPDVTPPGPIATELRQALAAAIDVVKQKGYDVVFVEPDMLRSEATRAQCMACCEAAVADLTFSEAYPKYIIDEFNGPTAHPYLQGTWATCRETGRMASMVFSNGMDLFGSLKVTFTQVRMMVRRWGAAASPPRDVPLPTSTTSLGSAPNKPVATAASLAQDEARHFARECAKIEDISAFVHLTLIATHEDHRGKGLAKLLIAIELLRWALRGRCQTYLNMALEKRSVVADEYTGRTRLAVSVAPASRRLYDAFGFRPVCPRSREIAKRERVSQSRKRTRSSRKGGGRSDRRQRPTEAADELSSSDSEEDDEAAVEGTDAHDCAQGGVLQHANGVEEYFTTKEIDSGKVLAVLDFIPVILQMAKGWMA